MFYSYFLNIVINIVNRCPDTTFLFQDCVCKETICKSRTYIHLYITACQTAVVENRFRKDIHFTTELLNFVSKDVGNRYSVSY